MNHKLLNRSKFHARWLISAAQFGLALLLLATTVHAQIAIQDGNPLAPIASLGGGPTVNKSFTVTPGASVLVVMLIDRQNAVIIPEPTTITWNGITLTQDTNSLAATSNYRSMAMYHLYNPPPGTGNITATYATGNNAIVVEAFTLSGVNTAIPPIILQSNNAGTVTSLFGSADGVTAGSWAAVGSMWGNAGALSAGGTGGTATGVIGTAGSSSTVAGYIANLSAGTVTIGVTNGTGTKGVFIAEIFAPLSLSAPPVITAQPQGSIVFTNSTVKLTVGAGGATPLAYQWFFNDTTSPLSDGGNLTGVTNSVLTFSNTTLANAGNYFVLVTNLYGAATSSVANLSFATPSGAYESAVMTNPPAAPFAFYTFSETGDPSTNTLVARDSAGVFNGTYSVASLNGFNGIAGPRATADTMVGFPDDNTALGTGAANSYVSLPPFNLNNGAGTNVLTITSWIYPNGTQPNAAGIVFCRGGSTIAGIAYLDNNPNNYLGYNWANDPNNYNWNSGLIPPPNVWSLVGLVITPTNATLYICSTNNGVLSATHVYPHVVQKFDGATLVGLESFNASRVFNGSIDEVALFGQALTSSQMAILYKAGSGRSTFLPTIPVDPTWAVPTEYAGQTASITVNAGGTPPLTYQWMAGAIGSGAYNNVVNGGNISGANSATLTITNVQASNSLDYLVQVSNASGSVTSVVPATLTVMDAGLATTFTLNYTGPVQQGIGADWNSINVWNPLGLPASTAVYANPGSTFEVVVGSRLRNPQATTFNVFPGDVLQIDGDGIFENGTVAGVGEIRFKDTTPAIPSTNYFNNLVLNGGQLNIGDSMDVILQGRVTVTTNSTLYALGTGINQTFKIDSYLTGSGTVQLYLSNSTPSAALVITGNTNTFTGQWNIVQGPLVGIGVNSLGTNTITIGKTNGMLETSYLINNPDGSLVLDGQMFLTQSDTFKSVYINGVGLAPGTYSAATLSAAYPSNFPSTFIALYGMTATTASGQITVLAGGLPIIEGNPTWTPATIYVGQTASITVSNIGTSPFSYQWMAGPVASGVYTDLPNGGNISGATSATLTISNAQLANYLDYVVRISNASGVVTSTVPATLIINDSGPFVVTDTTPNPATYYAGSTVTLAAAFEGSRPIAYQWVTDGGSGTFTNVPGGTNSTLVVPNVQAGSAGNYYLTATSLAGGPVNSSPSSLTVVPSTYAIHFGATNAITTADVVLNHPGVVTGAAVFGATAKVVTLGNGSTITFTADNSVASVTPGNLGAFAYPAPATTGNTDFDAVLNQCSADLGPKTITLNNLVAGHNYSVLLIGLDDRGLPSVAGSAPARLAYFQDPVVATDVSSTFHMGDSVYVMASFLAQTTTQTIIEQLPTANNGNMNALVVYDLSAVVTPPTLSLVPSGGGNLTLTWSTGSTLLQATNLLGPWTTNSTATSPYIVSPTNAQNFFRVRTP